MSKKYQYIILLILGGGALWYGYANRELFLNLKKISFPDLLVLGLLVFVSHILNGYRFKYLMRVFKINLNFREWFGLSICNSMFNYYLPARGGIVVRAYYLKNKYKFSYSFYTSLLTGSYIITLFLSAITGLLLTLLFKFIHGVLYEKLLAIFVMLISLILIITALLILSLKIGRNFDNEKLNNLTSNIRKGLYFFRDNKKLIVIFSALYLISIFILGARLFICFSAIDIKVLFLQTFIISSLTAFSMVLSLTPANLGIKEGVITLSAYLFGIYANEAMLVALIDRAVAVILIFSLGLIFSRILLIDLKVTVGRKEPIHL
jgi:hypothetical protein